MKSFLTQLRVQCFDEIAKNVKNFDGQFIVLTHLLHDRPEVLATISKIAPIALVIAVPYSLQSETLAQLKPKYNIITPSLPELNNEQYLHNLLRQYLPLARSTIILEIGGYFANAIKSFRHDLATKLIGVIEDTETGHRAYEAVKNKLKIPVVSIARSPLKTNEDLLVGASCLYSTEKLLRTSGFLMDSKSSLVLGYGKIGRGLAKALAKRHGHVMVYDINHSLRITALSEGFQIPERKYALQHADIIYGTTGTCSINKSDFKYLKNGSVLVSCSSKNVEFAIDKLEHDYSKTKIMDNLDKYEKNNKVIYLTANGTPINFIDGATIGPILTITQGEIIMGINDLINLHQRKQCGLFETSEETKQILVQTWIKCFCDKDGKYKYV
jgi:adenosylhomocysteinase